MMCEHNQYKAGCRCRKRATVAVVQQVLFATKCGPHGDEPVYMQRTTFRCPEHSDLANVVQKVPIPKKKPAGSER